ncbi:hypothetical protein HID58_052986 [Brassica napus]|uniref:Secreted protein n=1 Tax=Brassica napus TaxID=3708 RepID=A0ABQ8AE29_BRANA|nr:hypothetical protein HID58_052986 [Brassica napus]
MIIPDILRNMNWNEIIVVCWAIIATELMQAVRRIYRRDTDPPHCTRKECYARRSTYVISISIMRSPKKKTCHLHDVFRIFLDALKKRAYIRDFVTCDQNS